MLVATVLLTSGMTFSGCFEDIEERFVPFFASVLVVNLAVVVNDAIPVVLEVSREVIGFSVLVVPCFAGFSVLAGTVLVLGIIASVTVSRAVCNVGILAVAIGVPVSLTCFLFLDFVPVFRFLLFLK